MAKNLHFSEFTNNSFSKTDTEIGSDALEQKKGCLGRVVVIRLRSPNDQQQVVVIRTSYTDGGKDVNFIKFSDCTLQFNKVAILQEMKTLNHLQNMSTGISLIVQSLGFSFLGILSLLERHHYGEAASRCVNNSFCVAGSVASFVTGAAFLFAAWFYWSRYSRIRI